MTSAEERSIQSTVWTMVGTILKLMMNQMEPIVSFRFPTRVWDGDRDLFMIAPYPELNKSYPNKTEGVRDLLYRYIVENINMLRLVENAAHIFVDASSGTVEMEVICILPYKQAIEAGKKLGCLNVVRLFDLVSLALVTPPQGVMNVVPIRDRVIDAFDVPKELFEE